MQILQLICAGETPPDKIPNVEQENEQLAKAHEQIQQMKQEINCLHVTYSTQMEELL